MKKTYVDEEVSVRCWESHSLRQKRKKSADVDGERKGEARLTMLFVS